MVRSNNRQQILDYLAKHGSCEDPTGKATAKLRTAMGFKGTEASFTQMIASMEKAGLVTREIRGKRAYRIAAVADASPKRARRSPEPIEGVEMEYDKLASALLVQVVQAITQKRQGSDESGMWSRRRIQRLERRIDELERELSQSRADAKTGQAERDALQLKLEHSEGNLALLTERLSPNKSRKEDLFDILQADERVLLQQLRNPKVKKPGRAS